MSQGSTGCLLGAPSNRSKLPLTKRVAPVPILTTPQHRIQPPLSCHVLTHGLPAPLGFALQSPATFSGILLALRQDPFQTAVPSSHPALRELKACPFHLPSLCPDPTPRTWHCAFEDISAKQKGLLGLTGLSARQNKDQSHSQKVSREMEPRQFSYPPASISGRGGQTKPRGGHFPIGRAFTMRPSREHNEG